MMTLCRCNQIPKKRMITDETKLGKDDRSRAYWGMVAQTPSSLSRLVLMLLVTTAGGGGSSVADHAMQAQELCS
eukprot:1781157-Amphidinium_carterae.1